VSGGDITPALFCFEIIRKVLSDMSSIPVLPGGNYSLALETGLWVIAKNLLVELLGD